MTRPCKSPCVLTHGTSKPELQRDPLEESSRQRCAARIAEVNKTSGPKDLERKAEELDLERVTVL